jgi:hypothetical protein
LLITATYESPVDGIEVAVIRGRREDMSRSGRKRSAEMFPGMVWSLGDTCNNRKELC